MSVRRILREELRLKNFWLSFPYKEPFYTWQWRWPHWLFIVYRCIMAAYVVGAMIHYFAAWKSTKYNPMIFLTTWTYIVLNLHFIVALVLVIWITIQRRKNTSEAARKPSVATVSDNIKPKIDLENGEKIPGNHPDIASTNMMKPLPWYFNFFWFLANVISIWSLIVTCIYYAALFTGTFNPSDVNVHLMNSIVLLIDTMLCARPVKLLHAIYPIIYGLAYLIFSAIYWSTDPSNNVIYQVIMDWNQPEYPVIVMFSLALIVIPSLQFMYFGIYRLKVFIYFKIYGEEYEYKVDYDLGFTG